MIAVAGSFGYSDAMPSDIVTFKGRRYVLCDPGPYYRASNWRSGNKGPTNLHRAVWEFHRGKIPDGFNVHHLDGDATNNRLSNLALIEHDEHARMHTIERHKAGDMKPPSDDCRRLAAEYWRSKEGRAKRSKIVKASWKKREWQTVDCVECGKEFETAYPTRAKFCHLNCKMMTYRREGRV